MPASILPEVQWQRVGEFIAAHIGLHFPPERRADLQRGIAAAAEAFGLRDEAQCVEWLLSAPLTRAQLHSLATHLTVGETYFFREPKTFAALAEKVLPELIRARRDARCLNLRFWSAACCTGEEPYSLAILLRQALPDLVNWNVSILATDINETFLRKATAGVYGEWSFRESPPWFKSRYFRRTEEGRYAILPEIRQQVTFAPLNLADDAFPASAIETGAMDIIFCRNVLMYFTLPKAQKVVQHLHHALIEGGWLIVSPSEGTQTLLAPFRPVNFPNVILYQKNGAKAVAEPTWRQIPSAPAAMIPVAATAEFPSASPEASLSTARELANDGRLSKALAICERCITADKLDPAGHYLRAVILQELGNRDEARHSLQRAIYLCPGFVLAHFALGNLAREADRSREADKHFANALHWLDRNPPDDMVPESDGLTVARLREMIHSISALEASS